MKKLLVFIILIAFLIPMSSTMAANNEKINVFVDGKQLKLDVDPIVINGTTLVQYTAIFKQLGMQTAWDQRTKTVTGYNDYVLMKLTIGSKKAIVNNKEIRLSEAARVIDGRTIVPLRFISEATGAKVIWDSSNRKITITSAPVKHDLKAIMREHRWNESVNTAKKQESAALKSNTTSSQAANDGSKNKINVLGYDKVSWLGYAAKPVYTFTNDRLTKLSYQIDLVSKSKQDALLTVGELYGKLSERFGDPYLDEIYFTASQYYSEDIAILSNRIAAGQARISICWQIGYTALEIIAKSSGNGNISLSVVIDNTK